jgi:hypothetical protein
VSSNDWDPLVMPLSSKRFAYLGGLAVAVASCLGWLIASRYIRWIPWVGAAIFAGAAILAAMKTWSRSRLAAVALALVCAGVSAAQLVQVSGGPRLDPWLGVTGALLIACYALIRAKR